MSSADELRRERIEAKRDAEELAAIDILRKRLQGTGLSNLEIHTRVLEAYGNTNPKSKPEDRLRIAEEALGLPSPVAANTKPATKRARKVVSSPEAQPATEEKGESAADDQRMITQRGKR